MMDKIVLYRPQLLRTMDVNEPVGVLSTGSFSNFRT